MTEYSKHTERKILLLEPPFYRLYGSRFGVNIFPLSLGYLSGVIKQKTSWDVTAYNAEFSRRGKGIAIDFLMKKGYSSYLNNLINLSGAVWNELMVAWGRGITIDFLMKKGYSNYLNNLTNQSGAVWRELRAAIVDCKPDVLGISCKSQNYASVKIVAKMAKEINRKIVVVVGGPHPSMVGEALLECSDIDICVRGEGEETIVELLTAVDEGRALDDVSGIVFRKNDTILSTPQRKYIENLDSLPFPHEVAPDVLKDYQKYPITAFHRIFAIRGCPFNCAFCGSKYIWSRRPRYRSVTNVIAQIKSLQKIGLTHVHFDDDTFGVSKQYIQDLCQNLILHCSGLTWGCEIHVNLVDRDTINMVKAAGCNYLQLGIESGNNKVLEQVRKGITIEKALSACETIENVGGIHLNTFFMVGFPQETEESLKDTFNAMKKVRCNSITFGIFTPYPGTELFEFCSQKGLIDSSFDISLYNHQSPNNYFCPDIPRERFRELVADIADLVDTKNKSGGGLIRRIRELGIRKSLRRLAEKARVNHI
ncbi:B12-binding domain-containing radical SAM protein [Chloroflexota bacterium]